jgi:NADP-dependent 3-hydroxy acid dehydrogenase YdfG
VSIGGCRVVVTGVSSGLGTHTVRHLVGLGAHVLAAARRADRLEELGRDGIRVNVIRPASSRPSPAG